MEKDAHHMRLTLKLAKQGLGRVSPNPVVGAILVKDGFIVGKGYHQKVGTPHAEINALREAGPEATGSTLYVNLEPCVHFGRTPPCVNTIIQSGVKRVVVGMIDPNPLVSGKGIQELRKSGLEITEGILAEEACKLNEFFIKYITKKIPFVTLKGAMSLDGKLATSTGESRWISGEKSRKLVHKLRNQYDAVLVGISTIIKDDPLLTTRNIKNGRDPIRVIVDSNLRIPLDSKIIKIVHKSKAPTIVATTKFAPPSKIKTLESLGVEVCKVDDRNRRVNLHALLNYLGERNIISLLIEGGPTLNEGALREGIVDKVMVFINPRIIGGEKAPTLVGGEGIKDLYQTHSLSSVTYKKIGEDLLVEGYLNKEELCSQAL